MPQPVAPHTTYNSIRAGRIPSISSTRTPSFPPASISEVLDMSTTHQPTPDPSANLLQLSANPNPSANLAAGPSTVPSAIPPTGNPQPIDATTMANHMIQSLGCPFKGVGQKYMEPLVYGWAEIYQPPFAANGLIIMYHWSTWAEAGNIWMCLHSGWAEEYHVPPERMGQVCLPGDISTPLYSGWAKEYHAPSEHMG